MFTYAKPAEVGVSAKQIKKYVGLLEKYGLSTHSILMARGDKIFFEQYWEPFNKDFGHRLYSSTKSIVAIAVGFLVQDGKVSLDDRIVDYFQDVAPDDLCENVSNQTIRDMLMMSTGFIIERGSWFDDKPEDRAKLYFHRSSDSIERMKEKSKIPGMFFDYDSNGSFILGALVERVSGKKLIEYLREKLFDKIGISEEAHFLECPGGYSWGDSAMVCTSMDFLKMARFTLNYGKVNGEQILSEEYLREATSCLITNSRDGGVAFDKFGYGYQIWKTWNDSFFFNGMGSQFAVCVPKQDMILVCNADNQHDPSTGKIVVIDRFFEEIVETASDSPIADDEEAERELNEYCKTLKLRVAPGKTESETVKKISGKTFILKENPMGMKKVKLTFDGDEGRFDYENAQGEKTIRFGLGKNIFDLFPEEGYSRLVGSKLCPGNYYKCAASAGWIEKEKIGIMVQIIDEYFGRLYITINFRQDGKIAIFCRKNAEAFLNEYDGYADGVEE
ncbi:MAG: serine hydrolase [Ruminococcaceae bacterium]|nr:serine hydrolase [Oscillospiraceae bacterium]